jgi:hypothetical protein
MASGHDVLMNTSFVQQSGRGRFSPDGFDLQRRVPSAGPFDFLRVLGQCGGPGYYLILLRQQQRLNRAARWSFRK